MLKQAKNIYFVGIKGVAMANLAVVLKKMGKNVFGWDRQEEFITDQVLKDNNIKWQSELDPKSLPKKIDLVVYSAAHGGTNNPLIVEAKKRKTAVISQADLLGEIMAEFETKIAVTGCHGKTTTTSILAYCLNKLKAQPSYVVGVPYFTDYQGGDYQAKKYFVVEADEYGVNPPIDKTPKFYKLNPDYIVCTNIDFDHPDVYRDITDTKKAFLKFFGSRKIIACADDENIVEVLKKIDKKQYVTYGFSKSADYQIKNEIISEDNSKFELVNNNESLGYFEITIFGKMNILNATAVIVMLLKLGFSKSEINNVIKTFTGSQRRFEKIYSNNCISLFDDYAHHPSEIEATIRAAQARFKNRRVIVIFQPHTFSRTALLLKEFASSLSKASYSLILPIFSSAREKAGQFKVTSDDIVKNSKKKNLIKFENVEELLKKLEKMLKEGDIIFTMGAGNVYKLKEEIIRIIDHGCFRLKSNVDLFQYLTLKTHVIAEYFFNVRTREELIKAKNFSIKNKLPIFLFGGGSNLAVTVEKIHGLVIKNNYIAKEVVAEGPDYVDLKVSSGYPVSLLVHKMIEKGYSGFEYHKGLPGTVGGAIAMNSKWTRPTTYFGDNLLYAYLVDNKGKVKKVTRKYFKFKYDYSILKDTREFVLDAVFRLKKENKELLSQRATEALQYRIATQPTGIHSSGCFFKNISVEEKFRLDLPTSSAGYLIDKAGLKGYRVGDFEVSKIHANFIINHGKGKREDLLKLIDIIKTKVKNKYGISLQEEVIII